MPHSTESLKLTSANLSTFASQQGERSVKTPTYARDGVKHGIVHVGVGGFHRAHLAVYVDQLMQKHDLRDWAICGVGLRPNDAAMRDVLEAQDHLYTVIERSAKGSFANVVGSITGFLYAPDDREAVIAKMASPDTHIVSLTITESGYYYNENTHEMHADHPDIVHDLANGDAPVSTFGFLYAALARRHAAGLKPFTVMSCDNMQKNGSITRHMLQSFARLRGDAAVAEWIAAEGAFPNAMVDRITPSTSPADIASLAAKFGVEDAWPVVTEPFMQWVIEDKFSDGRPPFEKVGVQVVEGVHEVEQFEKHKLRLLNASHSAMAYPGQLAGFKYVHEVMEHPVYRQFVWQMMQQEVKPLLPEIAGVDIDEYCNTLMERFSNPTIMDGIPRVALGASGKIPQFIMPSIAEQIWVRGPFRRLCFVAGAWFRYVNGVDDKGENFEVDDPMKEELQALAKAGGNHPGQLLTVKHLFGDDLRSDERFVNEVAKAMELIAKDGVMATLPKYVD
ncbi:Mannitol 2-dehydrogenase [Colletotrichum viniferum]|nr:Mannitol 2-dehydrogenase [Colletotrichum viniferum]